MLPVKTFLILKYGDMPSAVLAYNQSNDWDADFTEDEQCMIVGFAWAYGYPIKAKSAIEYAMELVK